MIKLCVKMQQNIWHFIGKWVNKLNKQPGEHNFKQNNLLHLMFFKIFQIVKYLKIRKKELQ